MKKCKNTLHYLSNSQMQGSNNYKISGWTVKSIAKAEQVLYYGSLSWVLQDTGLPSKC